MSECGWFLNVTCNDISVIYVTVHICAGGLKKKLNQRSIFNQTQRNHPYFSLNSPVCLVTEDLNFQANAEISEEICDIEISDNVQWTDGRRGVEWDILASQITCLKCSAWLRLSDIEFDTASIAF